MQLLDWRGIYSWTELFKRNVTTYPTD